MGTTDASGAYAIRGFKGEYSVGVSYEDQAIQTTTSLSDGGTTIEISLDGVGNDGSGDADEGDGESSGPTTDAGSDQTASPGDTVSLDGSGSTGKNLSYEWFQMYESTTDPPQ